MDRWTSKVAVVTGASAGIGLAIALRLLENGMIVVGLARRENNLNEVHKQMDSEVSSRFHPIKCDISKEEEVRSAFKRIKADLGGVDILVNNAARMVLSSMLEMEKTEAMRDVVDTNIMGVIYCTQEAFASMKERNVDGHVVMINSTSGHRVPTYYGARMGVYVPTKFALTAMVESFRQAFFEAGTKVKVSSISPGGVDTGMSNGYNIPKVNVEAIANAVAYVIGTPPDVQNISPGVVESEMTRNYPMFSKLQGEDIADAVVYVIGTPPHVQSISPGAVETDMAKNYDVPKLHPDAIANAVAYVVGTPPDVQVHELIIKPIGEAF